jgi:hypothetical protein
LNAESEKIIKRFYFGKRSVKEMKKIFPEKLKAKKNKNREIYSLNFLNSSRRDSN